MAGGERTEKATPKKRQDARSKGQVANSNDLNGAVVLAAALIALSSFGPKAFARMQDVMVTLLTMTSDPSSVDRSGLGALLLYAGKQTLMAAAPVIVVCVLAGLIVNVAQVGGKPHTKAIKPDLKKLNPLKGAKQLLSPNSLVELGKNLLKVGIVGAIVVLTLMPKLTSVAALVGTPPADLLPLLAKDVMAIAQRASIAYLAIGFADLFYQRWRFEKGLRMEKQEVKDEHKQQEMPAEVRGARRRKQFEIATQRMMDAVPTADVVVVNPTHYSVALKYDSEHPAPVVVAKGVDNLAFKIREAARAADVAVVPDPPLARTLYATVDVGKMIPEDLFHAVAQLLAYVYRVAGARKAVAA
jgi:flagellar biosynthesis protein FlhB